MGIYVRKVKKGSRTYHYLVTSYREGQKVKQKKLKYLGANPAEDAVNRAKSEARSMLAESRPRRQYADRKAAEEKER